MFCETLNEEELYQAYILYASLHGLSTCEEQVRGRIESYLQNSPDETIDAAILAFSEDRIIAPPDVVLDRWGKSRVYELAPLPCGGWRHQVCESWFEAGCQFVDDAPVNLSHFWTQLRLDSKPQGPRVGSRCGFQRMAGGEIQVVHREHAVVGVLAAELSAEILTAAVDDIRYLALIDVWAPEENRSTLLVTRALASIPVPEVVEYAANAFTAPRTKC